METSKRRILFASSEIGFGGGERIFEDLVNAAIARGFEVVCAVPASSELERRLKKHAIQTKNVQSTGPRNQFDILIANDFNSLALQHNQADERKFICHGSWEFTRRKSLTVKILGAATWFISSDVANTRRSLLSHIGAERILQYGPRADFFEKNRISREVARDALGIPRSAFVIANVARFHPVKRLNLFADVLREAGFWGAVSVSRGFGTEAEQMAYEKFFRETRNSQQLVVVQDQDPHLVLSAADLFLSTSQSETLGVALIEAQRYGLPTISLAKGGALEVIREGISGFKISALDNQKVVKLIEQLSVNPELLQLMKLASLQLSQRRNPERALSQLIGKKNG